MTVDDEKLVHEFLALFKNWCRRDTSGLEEKLLRLLDKLRDDGLAVVKTGAVPGDYVIRQSVHGGPVFVCDGEIIFVDLDFARACKKHLGGDIQILKVIE